MKTLLKYIPSVIFAIIEILIVWGILNNAYYSPNADVIAGLVLIYASLRTFSMNTVMTINNLSIALAKDITDIKERIRSDNDIEDERDKLKIGNEKVNQVNIKFIIRGIGVFIIYIMALLSLLS